MYQGYIKELTKKTERVMEKFESTRNDDTELTLTIILECLPGEVIQQGNKYYFSREALSYVREDHVKRVRAKIQHGNPKKGVPGRLLPTDANVRRKRRIAEAAWEFWSITESFGGVVVA